MSAFDNERMDARRKRIFATGAIHAAQGKKPDPVYDGRTLGCMEQFNYYDGYEWQNPEVTNPYRSRT